VAARLAYEQDRAPEPEAGDCQSEQERRWPQTGLGRDETGGQGGQGDGNVAGCLVEAHRQAAAGGADEIDLHDHRARPGQALVEAEEDVGDEHPAPVGRPDQE